MRNVEGVRNLDYSHARCSCFFKLPSAQLNTQPSRSRVLRVYRGPNLGKTARVLATICSSCSLRPRTAQTRGSGPIGVRGGQFPPTVRICNAFVLIFLVMKI